MSNNIGEGIIVSGGLGFIGTNLVEQLTLKETSHIFILDNLRLGSKKNLVKSSKVSFINVDLSDKIKTKEALEKIQKVAKIKEIWHMAANSDIPSGITNPDIDFKDTFLTTYNLINNLDVVNLEKIHFASSSAIYGDHGEKKISEETAPLFPISNYGSFKLASEGILSAFVEKNHCKLYIYRFPNVVGTPATHGVIFDFIKRLSLDPNKLSVFGNGKQKKQYLHVNDLISAMFAIRLKSFQKRNVFNIGPLDEGIEVSEIAELTVSKFFNGAKIEYGNSDKGWIGDIPKYKYSVENLLKLEWEPTYPSSRSAVINAIESIGNNFNTIE